MSILICQNRLITNNLKYKIMKTENQEKPKFTVAGQKYYCPMKCEGNKTYDAPGTCPVCNMHLVPVK